MEQYYYLGWIFNGKSGKFTTRRFASVAAAKKAANKDIKGAGLDGIFIADHTTKMIAMRQWIQVPANNCGQPWGSNLYLTPWIEMNKEVI